MKIIDYNNISYEDFLEILPVLQMSYFFDIEDPEIFLMLFPVWNEEEGEVINHLVCGYGKDGNGDLIVCPIGKLNSHHPAEEIWEGFESFIECIVLVTGRFDGGNKITFTSIQGRLWYDDSKEYRPCEIQAAGEAILSKFFGDKKFGMTEIGGRNYCKTEYFEEAESSNPFSFSVEIPPAM